MTPFKLTFLQARMRLAKTLRPDGHIPYPRAKAKTSHEHLVTDLDDFLGHLRTHAAQGHCLYKGQLDQILQDESRSGHTVDGPTSWLMVDIDGLRTDRPFPETFDQAFVATLAEDVVALLPPSWQNVSYVAQASSKLGQKAGAVGMHLFFLLEQPADPRIIKQVLTALNFELPFFESQLELTKTGFGLRYKLDIVVNDNAREIFIAPPTFDGVRNPFPDDDERFVLVRRERECLPPEALTTGCDVNARQELKIKELRKTAGLSNRENAKYKTVTVDGDSVRLLLNPTPGILSPAVQNDHFCYYNLNGGDSRAYWHPVGKPDIIYNFKGEPPFRWVDVDTEGYAAYCATHKAEIEQASPVVQFMALDNATANLQRIKFDQDTNQVEIFPDRRENADSFYAGIGKVAPTTFDYWTVTYDPADLTVFNKAAHRINTFKASALMREPRSLTGDFAEHLRYGNAELLARVAPICAKLIRHALGDGLAEFNHFFNWLAFIFQHRRKSGTAWILQGAEGTGKGQLWKRIITPLMGEPNCLLLQASMLRDSFDAFRAGRLMVALDEMEAKMLHQDSSIEAKLKNWVTEERATVRAMRTVATETDLFENYLLFSNKHDIITMSQSDRRYNVAPRQEVKLEARYPEVLTAMDDGTLDAELPLLAGFLHAWQVNDTARRVPLMNEAKDVARRSAVSSVDEFCWALRDGDLGYFTDFLTWTITDPNKMLSANAARVVIRRWLSGIGNDERATTGDLSLVYNAITDSNLNNMQFGKLLGRKGLAPQVLRIDGKPARGLELRFRADSISIDDVQALAEPARNVTPIRKPA